MMDIQAALGHLGYREIEAIPALSNWYSLIDQQQRQGRVWVICTAEDVSADALQHVDAILTELPLNFAIVIVEAVLSADQLQLLTTWDFPCHTNISNSEELAAAVAGDEEESEQPAEAAASLLPQPGERVLDVLGRLRGRLLDLTLRNPLLNYRSGGSRTVPIVDELPRMVLKQLFKGQSLTLEARPETGATADRYPHQHVAD